MNYRILRILARSIFPLLYLVLVAMGLWFVSVALSQIINSQIGTSDWVWAIVFLPLAIIFTGFIAREARKAVAIAIENTQKDNPLIITEIVNSLTPDKQSQPTSIQPSLARAALTDPEKKYLQHCVKSFEDCGILTQSEVNSNELIKAADHDEEYAFDAASFVDLLNSKAGQGFAYSNLMVFSNHVEFYNHDIAPLITNMAKLTGQSGLVTDITMDINPSTQSRRKHHAVMNCIYDGIELSVPFFMNSKYMPYELAQNLAGIYENKDADSSDRFYAIATDYTVAITVLSIEQFNLFNNRFNSDELSIDRLGSH